MYKYIVFCLVLFISTPLLSNPNQEKSPEELRYEYTDLIIGEWKEVNSEGEVYLLSFNESDVNSSIFFREGQDYPDVEQSGKYFVSMDCGDGIQEEDGSIKLVTVYMDRWGYLSIICEEIISITKDKLVLKDASGTKSTYKKKK